MYVYLYYICLPIIFIYVMHIYLGIWHPLTFLQNVIILYISKQPDQNTFFAM